MPELPEVETVARELKRVLQGQKVLNIQSSWPKIFSRSAGGFARAKKELIGKTIKKVERSGKRIFIYLSNSPRGGQAKAGLSYRRQAEADDLLWITHLKMTGAYLYQTHHSSILQNTRMVWDRHIRAEFKLSHGTLYFSDIRKFGRMLVGKREEILEHKDIASLARDPFQITAHEILMALKKKSIPIKQALLDQKVISGIGNIYADEILWATKISPYRMAKLLKETHIKDIIKHARLIMQKSIAHGGTSMRDFINTQGEKGGYLTFCNVYGREGKKCRRNCGATVKRIVISTRSARFCPKCQK